ncbi:LuxR C-terminal-related transcriptional regulator [Streptomyces sp. NPDC006367]|uniref:LuxR C-terminal-related transcriptional regulator n=1 Tax=unclassified Streptomyces TaxID=2593676 RepID=UPI0033ABE9B3
MPAILRTPAPPTLLTPTERSVIEKIAAGLSTQQAADELGMKVGTLSTHLSNIGYKFGVISRPAKVHAALASRQAPAPKPAGPRPDFTADELLLLHAVATRSSDQEIAVAADLTGISPARVKVRIRKLADKAGANGAAHLVGLAHAWQVLGARTDAQPSTSTVPAPRQC